MPPIRRVYTPEERSHALELYVRVGPCQAARETGIKKPTIRSWAKKAGLKPPTEHIGEAAKATEARIAAKRAAIKEKLIDRAAEMLERMGESMSVWVGSGATPVEVKVEKPPAGVCKDLATTVGILIDKFRLEAGEVTSRDEHHNIQQSELDHDIDALLAEMAHREKAGAEGEADLTPVGLGADGEAQAADPGRGLD